MFIKSRCVMTVQEMQALPAELPFKATGDFWEEIGRCVTDEREAQAIGNLVYIPKWATAPFSVHN